MANSYVITEYVSAHIVITLHEQRMTESMKILQFLACNKWSWVLFQASENRITYFETRRCRRSFRTFYKDKRSKRTVIKELDVEWKLAVKPNKEKKAVFSLVVLNGISGVKMKGVAHWK